MIVVALLIASTIPLVVLYLIYTLDLYRTGAFKFVLLSFAAGLLAFFLAGPLNTLPRDLGLISHDNMQRFLAPVVEEILKAIILLFLVRSRHFTYFVDGAIFGFSAGIGFAVIENSAYILSNPNTALATAIQRVISTNLMHAAASASIGIALGLARFQRFSGRTAMSIAGLLLAIGLHAGFNNLVTREYAYLLKLIYAILVGGGAAMFIAIAIKRGLADEKKWIEEKLGTADQVEPGEAAAVGKMDKMDKLLAPLVEVFGAEKAAQVERLLFIQARLGILRKTAEKMTDDKLRKAVETEIIKLNQEMNKSRRMVGSYTMVYLRSTYFEAGGSVYQRLQEAIHERAQQQSSGVNIYDTLQLRISGDNAEQNEDSS